VFLTLVAEVALTALLGGVTIRTFHKERSRRDVLLLIGASAAILAALPLFAPVFSAAQIFGLCLIPSVIVSDLRYRHIDGLVVFCMIVSALATADPAWLLIGLAVALLLRLVSSLTPLADMAAAGWAVAVFHDIGLIAVIVTLLCIVIPLTVNNRAALGGVNRVMGLRQPLAGLVALFVFGALLAVRPILPPPFPITDLHLMLP